MKNREKMKDILNPYLDNNKNHSDFRMVKDSTIILCQTVVFTV